MMKISIIIPVYNDKKRLAYLLSRLSHATQDGHQVIVADGGSADGTGELFPFDGVEYLLSDRGRARQMNAGAMCATGEILWFLHVDSDFLLPLDNYMKPLSVLRGRRWGRFDVRLSGRSAVYRLIEFMMNRRSRLTGICTGDQGIFVTRELFDHLGGFADIPIMEDIEVSRRLKAEVPPLNLSVRLQTSSRRWEQNGVFSTTLLMWKMRLLYFFGRDVNKLARIYEQGR